MRFNSIGVSVTIVVAIVFVGFVLGYQLGREVNKNAIQKANQATVEAQGKVSQLEGELSATREAFSRQEELLRTCQALPRENKGRIKIDSKQRNRGIDD